MDHESDAALRDMPPLEVALLKRGVSQLSAGCDRCAKCRRTLLVGERLYLYESGRTLCELCRPIKGESAASSRLVHGPEFGHTLRIIDRRALDDRYAAA
jgi:hypothetical protein